MTTLEASRGQNRSVGDGWDVFAFSSFVVRGGWQKLGTVAIQKELVGMDHHRVRGSFDGSALAGIDLHGLWEYEMVDGMLVVERPDLEIVRDWSEELPWQQVRIKPRFQKQMRFHRLKFSWEPASKIKTR